ncbi:MAG: hypothetical protein HQ481_07480 [Alphaproteobacteria bacterium]|nr:hypothetical protein [Alphaproteobacteria bacterium]
MRFAASSIPCVLAALLVVLAWYVPAPTTPPATQTPSTATAAPVKPAGRGIDYRPVALPPPPARRPTLTPRAASPPRPAPEVKAVPARSVVPETVVPETKIPAAAPPPPEVRPTIADAARGARLLSRLEGGEGPVLELAWPERAAERDRLSRHLARCAGLVTAVLSGGRLWRASDPPGAPWIPDRRRVSGVMRQADGLAGGAAGGAAPAVIRAHHGLAEGQAVALVAQSFDARLLGGLARLVGEIPLAKGHVLGRYAVAGDRLVLQGLRVDGAAVPGRVDLGAIGRCGG